MLEELLWDCFEGPNTCMADWGLSATVSRVPEGATVLAFKLDVDAFREASGLVGKKCCDRLLLVLQKPTGKEPRLTFLLLEMKGNKLEVALEQLGNTLEALRGHLGGRLPEASLGRAKFIAVIVSDRATPVRLEKLDMEGFRKKHRASIFVHNLEGEPPTAELSYLLGSWTKSSRSAGPGSQS